tara:strand:- start:153 stop:275 length:123 start_codon:yes stop_codon:yes gene_type:complete
MIAYLKIFKNPAISIPRGFGVNRQERQGMKEHRDYKFQKC